MIVSSLTFSSIYDAFHTIAHDAGATTIFESFPAEFDVSDEFDLDTIELALSATPEDDLQEFLIGDRDYSAYIEEDYEGATITLE